MWAAWSKQKCCLLQFVGFDICNIHRFDIALRSHTALLAISLPLSLSLFLVNLSTLHTIDNWSKPFLTFASLTSELIYSLLQLYVETARL